MTDVPKNARIAARVTAAAGFAAVFAAALASGESLALSVLVSVLVAGTIYFGMYYGIGRALFLFTAARKSDRALAYLIISIVLAYVLSYFHDDIFELLF